jgi:hypothetical protein
VDPEYNGYIFWRQALSGGLQKIKGFDDQAGDIMAQHPKGFPLISLFSIEAKAGYPAAKLIDALKHNKNNQLRAFWEQATHQAKESDRLPMLIYKKGQAWPIIIGFDEYTSNKLNIPLPKITIEFLTDLPVLHLYNYKDFLSTMNHDSIIKQLGEKNEV